MGRCLRIFAGLLSIVGMGCSHAPGRVTDEDPSDKIPAIKVAVEHKDKAAIPSLIADLNSDDSAVRFYAIDALQRLTGQTLEYRYYDDIEKRKAAVARWLAWEHSHPNNGR